jgi:hypothetical protein
MENIFNEGHFEKYQSKQSKYIHVSDNEPSYINDAFIIPKKEATRYLRDHS